MKVTILLLLTILFLVAGSLIITSCTQEVTKTVTVTNTEEKTEVTTLVTRTLTVEKTVNTLVEGTLTTTVLPKVSTPVFDREPPEIPHNLFFALPGITYVPGDKPLCFECHRIPPLHEDWLLDTELCDVCHYVSDMPQFD